MRVLAIGATGFIGAPVLGAITKRGHEVAVLTRRPDRLDPTILTFTANGYSIQGSIEKIRGFGPDIALNFILYTQEQAVDFVKAFRGIANRSVVISSSDVYRNYDGLRGVSNVSPDPMPLAEDSPLRETLFPYRGSDADFEFKEDYEKILVEQAVMSASDLPATVLRLPAVYGPGDRQHRLGEYLNQMDHGKREISISEERANWCWTRGYVDNVATAIAVAATENKASGNTYNIGDHPAVTEKEWIEAIGEAANWNGEVVLSAEAPAGSLDFRFHLETDTSLIRKDLGFEEPFNLKESLKESVRWERGQ